MVFGVDNIEMVKLSKTGFTLIELLVVIAVITIISGMIVINFRKGEAGGRLQRSAQQIVQTIRRAQNMAISSVEHEGEVRDAYGIYFETQTPNLYTLFFDGNKNYKYDGSDERMGSPVDLEKGIKIESISTGPKLSIAFVPPDPLTFFNGKEDIDEVTITIKKEDADCFANPEDCKDIKVGKNGQVSIE